MVLQDGLILVQQRPSRAHQVLRTLRHVLGFLLANWYKFVILGLVREVA
jgi:hypothetical protein